MQPALSLDFIQYPSSEITDLMREDPFCPSLLQLNDSPSPELFDQEVDDDEEVSEFVPSEQINNILSGSRDTNSATSTKISTPSAFTNSTGSSYGIASSQYSFNVNSSDYSNPSEFETHGPVNSWLSSMQTLISTAELANHLPYNLAEAHGTMDLSPNFIANDYPIAVQQFESVTCVDPAALSAHVTSDSDAQMAPVKKPFKCPHCSFSSARKHNLKTHIDTHDKEAAKRFGCSTCGRRFTRKHDLRRHRETIHGDRMPCSSSSASGDSSRHLDARPDLSQHRTTTVSGDEQLTSESSLHPGPSSATGLEDLMTGSMRLG